MGILKLNLRAIRKPDIPDTELSIQPIQVDPKETSNAQPISSGRGSRFSRLYAYSVAKVKSVVKSTIVALAIRGFISPQVAYKLIQYLGLSHA